VSSGIVFRAGDELHYLPASVALKLLPPPEVARVPGAPPELLGVASVEGAMVPVVAIGEARGCLLVCTYLGERVGLIGLEVLATGRLSPAVGDALHEQVVHDGERAFLFDLAAVVARFRQGSWAV
jgi:hypothetical protein